MDTINNVASSASKMIWGDKTTESGTEPQSGETGAGTADKPFDQGNQDENTTESKRLESDTTGENSAPPNNPGAPETTQSGSSSKAGGFGSTEPSVGADPSSGQKPFQKQQGGDRPTDAPESGKEEGAVKEKKDEGEELLKKKDPNDHSGEPLKVHDGGEKKSEEGGEHPGQEGGDEQGKEKGTGEQWVKTSGLAADGGDFDATKPGAGREAERLLDQKGIHHGAEDSPKTTAPVGDKDDKEKKPSIGSKIKDKLHIGKH